MRKCVVAGIVVMLTGCNTAVALLQSDAELNDPQVRFQAIPCQRDYSNHYSEDRIKVHRDPTEMQSGPGYNECYQVSPEF